MWVAFRHRRGQPRATRRDLARRAETGSASKEVKDAAESMPPWFWRLVIWLLCMVWATNFAVIKEITAQPGVTTELYAVSRFTVAALAMAPGVLSISSPAILLRAVECGAWVAFGYMGQAIGLMTTTAAKSCFICSLNVVFVALIVAATQRKIDVQTVLAAVLAVMGVGFLELAGSQQFVIGDLFSLAQPIGFGMGYIRLEQIMSDSPKDAWAVTSVKLLMVALASWLYFGLSSGTIPDFSPILAAPGALYGVLWCGLITTALALVVESYAFRYVDATSASVIFTTEPLWAALFAVWLINEPLTGADAVGGALVIFANVIKAVPMEDLAKLSGKDEDEELEIQREPVLVRPTNE